MKLDMADVKVSLLSFLIVGLYVTIWIIGGKMLSRKYPVPGVSDVFEAL